MSHLVRSLSQALDGSLTPASCHALVRDAHDYLAGRAATAVDRAQRHTEIASWGTALKRIRVEIPAAERHFLITTREPHHNLVEVINQCATMERLLDALAWAASPQSGLADWTVVACHPTTSSAQEDGKKAALDHDLILQGPDNARARFEVSDVASDQDGNRKEEKDLQSLGVLKPVPGGKEYKFDWLPDRLFLVVSTEFGSRLLRPKHGVSRGLPRPIRYEPVVRTEHTTVIEILRHSA